MNVTHILWNVTLQTMLYKLSLEKGIEEKQTKSAAICFYKITLL